MGFGLEEAVDAEPVDPRRAYRGKPGYGTGLPWHQRRTTWTSRDGKVTKLKDLADSHLENILAFVRRKIERHQFKELAALLTISIHVQGEAANDAIESEIAAMSETTPENALRDLPIYQALVAEADRRAAAQGFVPAPGEWSPEPRRSRVALRVFDEYEDEWNETWGGE